MKKNDNGQKVPHSKQGQMAKVFIFDSVFHRILDFKTGLDFYPGPFFMPENGEAFCPILFYESSTWFF
jgi:hypothetical protein